MDVTIGKYKARMEDTQLVLTHPAGISFDLTLEEAIGLSDFLNMYREAVNAGQRETEPRIERVKMEYRQRRENSLS